MTKKATETNTSADCVKTADIYLAAYLLASGAIVVDLEVINELGKDLCLFTFKGQSIDSDLKSYHENRALIDPALYQKAINRVRDIIFKALDEVKKASNKGGKS